MRIATWNINGVKARLANLLLWLEQSKPDIVCLQEIKSVDAQFPRQEIENLGYHIETHGQKSFNGVALLAKIPAENVERRLPGANNEAGEADEQARFIEAIYPFGERVIRIASLYLPNGNPVYDTAAEGDSLSGKYRYKLHWQERLYNHARQRLEQEEIFILAGDYNVIPAALDAARPQDWLQDALFLPAVRQNFQKLLNLGFTDALRAVSDTEAYTFWDYQAGAWPKNNGIRIDHMLLSPEAADRLSHAYIDREVRNWEKPSDHVPVWAELKN